MYYLNSRYYSPEFGRFISADIFVSTGQGLQGANMFAYCGNNPVMHADPNGTFINTVLGAVFGGISAWVSNGKETTLTDVLVGMATGALAGAAVDLAIATGGTAAPIAIAAVGGAVSSAGNSMYRQNKETGCIKPGEVLIDAAIGAVSNVISLGMSCPKQRVTTGKLLKRLSTNSKIILEEGAKKVAQHGTKELIRKSTYNSVVAGNLALAVGESALMSASNTFWTEKVVPCLLY